MVVVPSVIVAVACDLVIVLGGLQTWLALVAQLPELGFQEFPLNP